MSTLTVVQNNNNNKKELKTPLQKRRTVASMRQEKEASQAQAESSEQPTSRCCLVLRRPRLDQGRLEQHNAFDMMDDLDTFSSKPNHPKHHLSTSPQPRSEPSAALEDLDALLVRHSVEDLVAAFGHVLERYRREPKPKEDEEGRSVPACLTREARELHEALDLEMAHTKIVQTLFVQVIAKKDEMLATMRGARTWYFQKKDEWEHLTKGSTEMTLTIDQMRRDHDRLVEAKKASERQVQDRLQAVDKRIKNLDGRLKCGQSKCNDLEDRCQQLDDRCQQLEHEATALDRRRTQLEDEIGALKRRTTELEHVREGLRYQAVDVLADVWRIRKALKSASRMATSSPLLFDAL